MPRKSRRPEDGGAFRVLGEASPDPVAVIGPGDEIEYVNGRFTDVFGYARDEIPDIKTFIDRVFPDDAYRAMVRALWAEDRGTLAEGAVRTRVFSVRCRDGVPLDVRFRMTRSGTHISLFMEDVTGSVPADRARRAGEVMFRAMFERAGIAICVTDMEGRIIMANRSMLDMLRCGEKWLIGKTIFDISHPDDVEPEKCLIRDVMGSDTQPVYRIEKRYVRRDGTQLWARLTGTWVIDDQGRFLFGLGMAEEITEEKEIARKLEESEMRFMALVEQTIVGVYIMQDEKFQYVNPALASMLGYEPNEIIGRVGPSDLVEAEDLQRVNDKIARRISGEIEAERYETRFAKKGGGFVSIEIYGARMIYRGRPALIGTMVDITERLNAQREERARTERIIKFQQTLLELSSVDRMRRETAFSAVTEETAEALGADRVSLWLLGDDGIPVCEDVFERNAMARGSGLPSMPPAFIGDIDALAEAGVRAVGLEASDISSRDVGGCAVLDAAVRVHGRFSGILRCEQGGGERRWLLEEMNFLSSMSNIVSLVLSREERANAMSALVESEERFAHMAESIRDGWTIVEKGRVVYVNPRMSEITGYPVETLKGMTGFDIAAPEERDRLRGQQASWKARSDHPDELDFWIVRSDGERRYIQNRYSSLTRNGVMTGLYVVTTDITERKNAERFLAEEKERLSITLRSLTEGVIAVDAGGKVTVINRAAEGLTGWSVGEAVGSAIDDIYRTLGQEGRAPRRNPLWNILEGGPQYSSEGNTLVPREGEEKIVEESAAPLTDAEGERVGAVLVFRDITERVAMERELQKAQKLESVGILAGGIAHDFNNILTAILGNISIAGLMSSGDGEISQVLSGAEKAALRARDLTQQLLVFSRGGAPIKRSSAIEDLVADSANFVLLGTPVSCRISIGEGIHHADIDRGQISQVVQNLVINARQAMPDGGVVDIRVDNEYVAPGTVPSLAVGKYVRIRVEDRGQGIAPEDLPRIFDPYFTTKEKGSGLGLAISYRIVRQHGGNITAESETGKGAVFTVYLPASEGTDRGQVPEEPLSRGTGRVLVMDDEDMVRDVAGQMLCKLGYRSVPARDGREAIEIYERELRQGTPFDAVIMDLTVPGGMGGMETSARMRAIDPAVKIIVCSGYSNDPVMSEYQKHGFTGVLTKPFRFHELAGVLEKAIPR